MPTWTNPVDRTTGDLITATIWNQGEDQKRVLKIPIADDGSVFGPLKGYHETRQAVAIVSNNVTVDCSLGNHVDVPLIANITSFTLTNIPATGKAFAIFWYFTGDGTVRSITWSINTHTARFPSNSPPVMTGTNGKVDEVVTYFRDGGTTWFAKASGFNL